MNAIFDRTFLPEALFEFVVVSDTHYMLPSGTGGAEFESRRLQSARADRALRLIACLDTAFVVHLGDLVQSYPEEQGFDRAVAEAHAQLERCGVRPRFAAGNHDVGDKPDPTAPTAWVTSETLASYHSRHGRSWHSWDEQGVHFVVLNTQILNADLPEAADQQHWAESDLRAHTGKRICLFLHLSPFLETEHEPSLGHYDNIAEPGRSWLLDLLREHSVELVCAGHTHFALFDKVGTTRYFVVPSSSFTRSGFSEVFSSCPPPERGRNDSSKLGFYLVRVHTAGMSVHFIRTGGDISPVGPSSPERYLITGTSRDLPHSRLGIGLRHPIAQVAEVPIAWPSVARQRIRNDYPLLACVELGIRHVRVPASDLDNGLQSTRLALLREEGVQITASWLWSRQLDLPTHVARKRGELDEVEIQVLGSPWPDKLCLSQIRECKEQLGIEVMLSPVIPRELVSGKQHMRTRMGYRHEELPQLERHLAQNRIRVGRVLCRIDPVTSPWDALLEGVALGSLSHVGAVDWLVELPPTDEEHQTLHVAEAVFATALMRKSRLFLEPLIDLDRTMDASYGLLDRICNPRPVFHVVRCLNTILSSSAETWTSVPAPAVDGARILGLRGHKSTSWLLLPLPPRQTRISLDLRCLDGFGEEGTQIWAYQLRQGKCENLGQSQRFPSPASFFFDEPTLLLFTR